MCVKKFLTIYIVGWKDRWITLRLLSNKKLPSHSIELDMKAGNLLQKDKMITYFQMMVADIQKSFQVNNCMFSSFDPVNSQLQYIHKWC